MEHTLVDVGIVSVLKNSETRRCKGNAQRVCKENKRWMNHHQIGLKQFVQS